MLISNEAFDEVYRVCVMPYPYTARRRKVRQESAVAQGAEKTRQIVFLQLTSRNLVF